MTNDEFVLYWLNIYAAIASLRLVYLAWHDRSGEVPWLFRWMTYLTAFCLFIIKFVV